MRFYGCGLAAMGHVAEGKFDIFFNIQTNPWDILPGALLVQEAGGIVTDINGDKISYQSNSVVASNDKVHKQILRTLEDI